MILSFSVPEMKQYVIDGIQQAKGLNIKTRVKRQTIRAWGPQAERVLRLIEDTGHFPYPLSHWWKSRTPEREFLGTMGREESNAYNCDLAHHVGGNIWASSPIFDQDLHWHPDCGGDGFVGLSYADGFDSPEAFRDYFVPNPGDVFKGILYKW